MKKMIEIEFDDGFMPCEKFDEDECNNQDCPFLVWVDDYGYGYCAFPGSDEAEECPIFKYF